MKKLFSLGDLYVSDFLKENENNRGGKVDMSLILDEETGLVRLEQAAPLDTMYGKYWYRSGINNTMKTELKNIVDSINKIIDLKENDLWVDIACNDGTLLSYVSEDLIRIGIDPVDEDYVVESSKHSDLIIQDYFSSEIFKQSKFGTLKAKVITSIAMFYDLEEPKKFINDVYEIIDDNGVWVLQLSYSPLMIKQVAFDNICHEHWAYHNLSSVQRILATANMKVLNAELNDVNGGSIRIYAVKNNANMNLFGSAPKRDVWAMNVQALFNNEHHYENLPTWLDFANNVSILRMKTTDFIDRANREGKSIWAYGASTKGNTLLQYFDLDNTKIEAIAERNPDKWGLHTIGTNIVIKSEEDMREAQPDYVLVLPWHFISEFLLRESEYLQKGGAFIVPCPQFRIYTKEDLK
jgi:hypothetical protein